MHKYIFANKIQSSMDYEIYYKIHSLQWVEPAAFGVPPEHINKPMWDLAIKELQQIERSPTPRSKVNSIFSSFKLIDSTFSLFNSRLGGDDGGVNDANADDMLQIFPYIVLKAKIERLYAHIK